MIGSSLVAQLLSEFPEDSVRAVYRTRPAQIQHPRLEWLEADLTRPDDCRRVARNCSHAILTAAETGGAVTNQEAPARFLTDNLVMNTLLLQALAEEEAQQVVFLSSSMVYPGLARAVVEQDLDLNQDPPAPFEGIGWALRSSEKVLRYWHQQGKLQGTVVRLSYVYGPRARFSPSTSNFVPAMVRRAVSGENPFEIWGDPTVVRDLLFVDDCSRALTALLVRKEPEWLEVNLSSGVGVTVGEVAQKILRLADHPAPILNRPGAPSSLPYRVLSNERIKRLTGWEPLVSLDDGLAQTIEWWREHQLNWTR